MPDMIDSEATTAGAVRQSVEGEAIADVTQIRGSVRERNDLARQLAEVQDRVARETSEILNAVRALPQELQQRGTVADGIRALVAHNTRLRRVVEEISQLADSDKPVRVLFNEAVALANRALSSSLENPYAAVVEAEREVIEAAKAWLASGRAEKAKNDAGQDDWYSAHADVCNRLMDAVDALNNLGGVQDALA